MLTVRSRLTGILSLPVTRKTKMNLVSLEITQDIFQKALSVSGLHTLMHFSYGYMFI